MSVAETSQANLRTWLSRLTDRFIRLPASEIDSAIVEGLREIVEYLDVDRSTLFDISGDSPALSASYSWAQPGITPFPPNAQLGDFPWMMKRLEEGRTLILNRTLDDLPAAAAEERAYCQTSGLLSNLTIPVLVDGQLTCSLSIGSLRRFTTWTPEVVDQLQLAGQILAAAVHRHRLEADIERVSGLARDFFDSLDSKAAVLDSEGRVIYANRTWLAGGDGITGLLGEADEYGPIGTDYLDRLNRSAAENNVWAALALVGIRAILTDKQSHFKLEYPCATTDGDRWLLLRALRRESREGGAVLMHVDITQRMENTRQLERGMAEIDRLRKALEEEKLYLQEEIKVDHDFENIVGKSAELKATLSRIERVAPTGATVLLLGETGTGKELFAHAIHDRSSRGRRALIKVNCAALPTSLIESELFGHMKGAFTGAIASKKGRFELADQGTLFLDEIGDLDLDLQAKLLRVLQSGEFERVGGTQTIRVDVRLIAATHQDLEAMVEQGAFRENLFHRLNTFPIEVLPLRRRSEDIPLLVWHFLERCEHEWGRRIDQVPAPVMTALKSYAWPGNVRELQNVVERAVILSEDDALLLDPGSLGPIQTARDETEADDRLDSVQSAHISRVLESCGWRINGPGNAAARLGIHPNTLRHRLKKLGIERPR